MKSSSNRWSYVRTIFYPPTSRKLLNTNSLVRKYPMLLLIIGCCCHFGSSANTVVAFSKSNSQRPRNGVNSRSLQTLLSSIKELRWKQTTARVILATPLMSSSSDDFETPLVTSRRPHQLANGRGTFLGFRNVKDLRQQSIKPLQSSVQALMPDGGLSPCVIRVLGVGGGGCNAVRQKL
jgi:hypothetical protein